MVNEKAAERFMFLMTLKPGREAEYQRRHDEIWPEMLEALTRSGFTNYTLFRHELTVTGYAECMPDIETANKLMGAEPVTERWNDSFRDVIEPASPDGGYGTQLEEIWHLA